MRYMLTSALALCVLSASSAALAGVEPMSEDELFATADLVVDGEITAVSCNGEPTEMSGGVTTSYVAELSVVDVLKGQKTDGVKLPFGVFA